MDPFGMMMALSFFLNNLAKNFNLRVVLIKIPSLLPATLTSYISTCVNNIKGFLFSQRLLNGISEANGVYFWLGMAESINGRQGD